MDNEITPLILKAKNKCITKLLNVSEINIYYGSENSEAFAKNRQLAKIMNQINENLIKYKQERLEIKKTIIKDYIDNNGNIEYSTKYGDYNKFKKYTTKIYNNIKQHGLATDKNGNWVIRGLNKTISYNIFEEKNRKYLLTDYYNANSLNILATHYNNTLNTRCKGGDSKEMPVVCLIPLCITITISIIMYVLCLIFQKQAKESGSPIIIVLLLIFLIVVCIISYVFTLLMMILGSHIKNNKNKYKREKYYNLIGIDNMELLVNPHKIVV